jgi:hypothetical protein
MAGFFPLNEQGFNWRLMGARTSSRLERNCYSTLLFLLQQVSVDRYQHPSRAAYTFSELFEFVGSCQMTELLKGVDSSDNLDLFFAPAMVLSIARQWDGKEERNYPAGVEHVMLMHPYEEGKALHRWGANGPFIEESVEEAIWRWHEKDYGLLRLLAYQLAF